MSMTPQTAAARISRELIESETNLDQAIASSAALLASMAQARIDTDAHAAEGQVAMMRLVRGITSLTEARADMIRTHGELLKIAETRADFPTPATECPSFGLVDDPHEVKLAS